MVHVVYERCCGLDIHKQLVDACLLVPGPGKEPRREVRSFGTMTDDLLQLADWPTGAACTHVPMESTGIFWKPIYNLLEGSFELLLANARHIKQVPGRKTDVLLTNDLLTNETDYQDLGPTHFAQRDQQRVTQRWVRRLEGLGYRVELKHSAA